VFTPSVDIFETDAAILVVADMPGVRADGLSIDLRENVLSIEGSVAEYKLGYQLNSANPDITGMLGNMLFALAEVNSDDSLKQESLNYMDKYLKEAPKDHRLRAEIQGYADQLKESGLKPQKIN